MALRNYQEDLVMNLINIALEEYPDLKENDKFKLDLAAYTLNRIKPKYFLSERGFTRFTSDYLIDENDIKKDKDLIEIMMIIYMAIDKIKERRKSDEDNFSQKDGKIDYSNYIHNFPQLIGKVVDKETEEPIYNSKITLYINGLKAESADSGWPNPYITNKGSRGFYSFWPKSISNKSEELRFNILIDIQNSDYEPVKLINTIHTTGSYIASDILGTEKILNLPTCYLLKK